MPEIFRYGDMHLNVLHGDITDLDVDAIVNAANNHFWMGAGVAGAIKRKGGEEIEREAMARGPKPVGEVVITSGGRLKARYVIHAAVMGQDLQTDDFTIYTATFNSLKAAESLGIESIAFPALGTGVGGIPYDVCARSMYRAMIDFFDEPRQNLKHVFMVLYSEDAYETFLSIAEEMF